MKKLFLLIAILLLAGCKGQTLMDGVQVEQLYIDRLSNMVAVKRDGTFYYVLINAQTGEYTYKPVPYFNIGNMEKLPRCKVISGASRLNEAACGLNDK